jgi:hypothetical protein
MQYTILYCCLHIYKELYYFSNRTRILGRTEVDDFKKKVVQNTTKEFYRINNSHADSKEFFLIQKRKPDGSGAPPFC